MFDVLLFYEYIITFTYQLLFYHNIVISSILFSFFYLSVINVKYNNIKKIL